jgi:EAL domain-containing protein (putative c-di-GMP-specific phosphodiesterase class I)
MSSRQRLLGFAFAASDLLIELDAGGRVVFALGAGPTPEVSADRLIGLTLAQLMSPEARMTISRAVRGLGAGRRLEPTPAGVLTGDGRVRPAVFNAFRLPDLGGAVSCAISWAGEAVVAESAPILAPGVFADRVRTVLAGEDTEGVTLDFIDVAGLAAGSEAGGKGSQAAARIEAAIQAASVGGDTAAKLAPERYALLRDPASTEDLKATVVRLGREAGLAFDVTESQTAVDDAPPVNILRALRLAAEDCLKGGVLNPTGAAFNDALARTLNEAEAFRAMVRDRAFEVHYQPIIDLKTGAVHHFEALSRFASGSGPAGAIRLAEELALIEGFDLAVLEKVTRRLKQPGAGLLKIAVNVSGASLADDGYIRNLMRLTAADPGLRRRLIVEVTESAALADIDAANRRLSLMRDAGVKVCIDDFGAGAASFDYIRKLQVDTVKIDGSLVQGVEDDARARTLVGHLVELCASLDLTTVAEMVETEAAAEVLRGLGVDYGQGWLFGKAEAEPRTVLNGPAVRRAGAVEAWG